MKKIFLKEDSKKKKIKKSDEQKEKITEKKSKNINKKTKENENQKDICTKLLESRKKKTTILIISITIIMLLLIVSTIFSIININNENIISGISIEGIDISGLSKKEAMDKIQNLYQEKKQKEIGIRYKEYETSLNSTIIEVNYEVESAVDKAYLIGRDSNIFVNNYNILFTLIGKKNINVEMKLNEEVAKKTIQDISMNLPGVIVESSYSIEGDKLIITKGKEGITIDIDELLGRVKENLNNINIIEDDIDIPVIDKKPKEIDIDKIHNEIYKEAKDAYYTKEPFTVYPEVEGIDFNVEDAKKILQEEKGEYEISLVITKPNITIADIGTEAFPDKLATFTTRYDVSNKDRTVNLVLACQKLNEKVVSPGEVFSYNKTLGARTVAAGYKNAKVYSNGEVVDGIGGGICQISSTLYNSVLLANLEIVERRNHQFVTSYLPAGRDATVVYGMTDFQFKNIRKYPIRIVASAQNGIATVSIYGLKEENEYTFTFNTKTIASIPFTVKYVEDSTLPVGTEKIKQKGANGLKTETYITKILNGKVVSTTLLSKDTYDAMNKIVLKGTKGATVNNMQKQNDAQKSNEQNNNIIIQDNKNSTIAD